MKVLITGDRTTVSNFRKMLYVGGFVSGFPKTWWSYPFYKYLNPWCSYDKETGVFREASLGARKVESSLAHEDIECKVVHPGYLNRYVEDGDAICVSCVDPLGIGPTPLMTRYFLRSKKDNFLRIEFNRMMERVKKAKESKKNVRVVVGGPGAPHLVNKMKRYSIDHVYFGEAEKSLPPLIENGSSKKIIRGMLPKAEEIWPLINPSNKRVEISRGCGRGCKFCGPALKGKMREVPLEYINRAVKINKENGGQDSVIFQSEDFLLYGAQNLVPQKDAIMELFKSVLETNKLKSLFGMHISFASILSNPELIDELSKYLRSKGQKTLGSQPGIETGSHRLLKKLMAGKLFPFKDMEWKEVVLESINVLRRNKWFFVSTIIVGLPGETDEDVEDTIDLVESMNYERGLVIPLFFSPVKDTGLEEEEFLNKPLTAKQLELVRKTWKINLKKVSKMYKSSIDNNFVGDIIPKIGINLLKTGVKVSDWLYNAGIIRPYLKKPLSVPEV